MWRFLFAIKKKMQSLTRYTIILGCDLFVFFVSAELFFSFGFKLQKMDNPKTLYKSCSYFELLNYG